MHYTEKSVNSANNTWLYLSAVGDGLDLVEADIPTPNYYHRTNENDAYSIGWLLDGVFHTAKNKEYLNDVIARMSLAMQIQKRFDFAPINVIDFTPHKLKEFQNLPSLPRNRSVEQQLGAKNEDAVFWALKLEAIARIRAYGWLDYQAFEMWAFNVFYTDVKRVKDGSTLRAKCRSIHAWYEARDWKIESRNFTMTRTEAMGKARAVKTERVKAKIQGAINILRLYGTKITAKAVAEEAQIALGTAQKYVKELKISGAV